MVVRAVKNERVSTYKFPAIREIYKEFPEKAA
jgi:hypothetical protein